MNVSLWQRWRRAWHAEFLSPKDFIRRAITICIVFGVAHICGLRETTSILSGTTGAAGMAWKTATFLGLTYIFLYLTFVILVPILLLAAAISAICLKFARGSQLPSNEP